MSKTDIPDYIGHRQRVTERLIASEGSSFADYELLEAVLMRTIPRRDVKPIAKELIRKFGSVQRVLYAPPAKLAEVKWIKENTISMFILIRALFIRTASEKLLDDDKPVLTNHDSLIEYCRVKLAFARTEELMLIYLDGKLRVIDCEIIQKGSLDKVPLDVTLIPIRAYDRGAKNIIMVHNHPSGSVKPSAADKIMTQRIETAGKAVNITLWEHLIISPEAYFSFLSNGLLHPTEPMK